MWQYESWMIPLAAVGIGYLAELVDINTALMAVGGASMLLSLAALI